MAKKEALPSLKAGIDHIRKNPQLWWTVLMAAVIMLAFVFVAYQFVAIARESQERLINERVGSIQDSYSEFVTEFTDDTEFIQKSILNIVRNNPTIQDFKVVQRQNNENVVIASLNKSEVDFVLDDDYSYILSLAAVRPDRSITVPITGSERFFHTIRAFTNDEGDVEGYVLTTQTLSEADRIIDNKIRDGFIIFFVVLLIVIILFLRHAKIIDYVSLYKQLKEVDSLKDDFISMASHELRTPLTVIRGYVEFLNDDEAIKGDSKDNLDRIDLSAQQLDRLVADMLDVSRIEQGRMKFEYTTEDPRVITKEVVDSFQIPAHDKKLELSLEIESSAPIHFDVARLKQVLVNIIGNSIKYTLSGEVKVKLATEDGYQVIRVSDTGIGMDANAQKKLFQKFYRVKSEQTSDIRGTGLGLWITKQIVEAMGGEISVESIKGVGSHFIIKFPIVK